MEDIRVSGALPFRIIFELETVEARGHAEARTAAQRIGAAIDELRCERPDLEELPLVRVRRLEIERADDQTAD